LSREFESEWDDKLYQKVDRYNLVENLRSCLQCGKCTGNCPVAALNPSYNPRAIINDILSGNTSRLLDSEEIWRCFWCANCLRVCPVDINYPFLMMQLRYLAAESGYGLKYVNPINKYAFRALEEGLSFVPGEKGVERIKRLRSSINAVPWPEVSDRAKKEYKEIFELTGAYDWMKKIESLQEKELRMSFKEGRITNEL